MRLARQWTAALAGLTLAVLALTPARVTAQVGNSSLSGLITYSDGQPANARVFVGYQGKYRQVATRFRGGKNVGYSIPGLLPGRYELIVSAPAGKPRRIWGVTIGSFDEKQLNIVLQRCAAGEERFYTETGVPIQDDMPFGWQGGWLQGTLLTQDGLPVEGNLNFYRGPTLYLTIPAGASGLPAYFETRMLPPGTWDVMFIPSPSSKLKRIRLEKLVVDQNSRTVLGSLTVPPGTELDAPVVLALPERQSTPLPTVAPRPKRGESTQ